MKGFYQIFSVGMVLLACAGLSSCSPPKTKIRKAPLDAYDFGEAYLKNSCLMSFDEGSSGPLVVGEPDVRASFFSKPFDFSRPAVIGDASMRAIAELLRSEGVVPYALPLVKKGACAPLKKLTPAPEILREFWRQIAGATALAVFLPRDQVEYYGEKTPVILVRSDSDRYTLIHEYLHHIFNSLREKDGIFLSNLFDRYDDFLRAYEKIGFLGKENEGNREKALAFLKSWTELQDVKLELFRMFPLEEMSVESLLQIYGKEGKIGPVTHFNRVNSVEYIAQSDRSVREELSGIIRRSESNQALADRHGLTEWLVRSKELNERARKILDEANTIMMTYGTHSVPADEHHTHSLEVRSSKMTGLAETELRSQARPVAPCGHTLWYQREMKRRNLVQ